MVFVSKPTKMQSQYICEFIRGNIILINLIRKFSKISAKWAKLKMILILRMTDYKLVETSIKNQNVIRDRSLYCYFVFS